jgi:hypothetical protein
MPRYNASSIQVQWLALEGRGAGKLGRGSETVLGIAHWRRFAEARKRAEKEPVDGKL